MKQGRKPTRRQMDKLKKLGLVPQNWLISKNTPTCFEVVHRISGAVRRLGA